ncbi:MAG: carbohydrate kinase family protein, partial [Thermoplasmata archaeon]|nr:carbohydrate kinase family protein [Thermoplasmata archaeon]
RAGASTSLDMSTDPFGWTRDRVRAARMCLPQVDTFFGNEVEVSALGGTSSVLSAARRILALGAGEVVVHSGDRGSISVTPSGVTKAAAFDVRVDNPTGCGDVFNAAYVYARHGAMPVLEALCFANACSALHLEDRRRPYARVSEIRRFLARFASS